MRLLFVMYNANFGGIQTALLNQIKVLKKQQKNCEIDLFLFRPSGELINDFRSICNIYPCNKKLSILATSIKDTLKTPLLFFLKLFIGIICKFKNNKYILNRYVPKCGIIQKEYDAAISYSQNCKYKNMYCGANSFVLNCVKSSKKYCFIHGDYIKSGLNIDYYNEEIQKFDKVFCVSESCKRNLLSCLPITNCFVIRNIIDTKTVIQKSKQNIDVDLGSLKKPIILTVSRISSEKGILRGLACMSKIKDDFTWIIIGDGPLLKKATKEYGKSKKILFLGYKDNPFSYMRICDFLFICSFYEAAPMVIDEAHILSKQVIMTNCSSSQEQLTNGDYIISNITPLNSKEISNIITGKTMPLIKNYKEIESYKLIDFLDGGQDE